MAKTSAELAKERLKDGWIKAWAAIEVLAITEAAADSSLTKHVEKMETEDNIIIYQKEFKKTEKVQNPFDKSKDAYSKVVEMEFVARRFEHLAYLVMNYAPSSIEILEPSEMKIKTAEAQTLLNTISELMHHFVALNQGAVTIKT